MPPTFGVWNPGNLPRTPTLPMVETGIETTEGTEPASVRRGPRRRLCTMAWHAECRPTPQSPVQPGQSHRGPGAGSVHGPGHAMGLPRTDRLLQPGIST